MVGKFKCRKRYEKVCKKRYEKVFIHSAVATWGYKIVTNLLLIHVLANCRERAPNG